nr:hypothetical protein [Bacteroidota bacterium]
MLSINRIKIFEKVVLIVLIHTSIMCNPLFGQKKNAIAPVNFLYYNNQKYIGVIEFINTDNGEVLKSFNVVENNPFNNLAYPVLKQSKQGYNVYEIDDVQVKDINLNGPKFVIRRDISDSLTIKDGAIKSYHSLKFRDTSYFVLKYHLNLYVGDELLGVSNTVYIFKKDGKLMKKFDQLDTQCLTPCVTSDGKYFAYGFGGVVDESLSYFDNLGYRIIDLENESLIVDAFIEKKYHDINVTNDSNLVRLTLKTMNTRSYWVYDFNKQKKFNKEYSIDEMGLWIDVLPEGFVFELDYRGSGNFRTDYFETDFNVEAIK